ncbi:MAG TPA: M23 family metallopeptidase [Chloroflexi bacterium]|mgnify:CR=1 FL=1|nr:M23 family metallopeptidase [Chloroflexota bacterium]
MDTKTSTRHRLWTPVALLLALLLVAVLPASAAYRVQRPITYDGGRLNQSYLYGEVWGTSTHKGVDFSYDLGTDVYAIADGTVVDLYEDYDNGDDSDPLGWGNRVLIRHSARHWDRTTQQWAYVYSIYAHLSKNSVRYSIGQFVYAGTWIAEVDDTGLSSGHHLHLQICIHSQSDRTITNLGSSTTSLSPPAGAG